MKNVQIIDEAINSRYAIYSVSDDEFAKLFPGERQDIEFVEDVIDRLGEEAAAAILEPMWDRMIPKPEIQGIHGTLFFGLTEKRKFYENKREPVIDWRLVD
ncbi:hypothetical protein H9L12_01010 [Sphingomonas rhizophila]|uniref:Uncharacterized protein n=1 Tax=Sphingomonas rhizophila TaxID=2071607 RepID=A0A7G9SBN6_9SPHN|nr:hypothetical protein [Sphingomonas rhizophila]QNN65261.1 hypothetical protein H9L12_01010 [Sphingomonas rhizophila]